MEDLHEDIQNDRERVRNTRKLFQDMFNWFKSEKTNDKRRKRTDLEVAKYFSDNGKSINREKRIGHVPGIEVGDCFRFRTEMAVVGLHCHYVSGIDYMKYNGKNHAISVVDSGIYENEQRGAETVIFCGQGGQSEEPSERTDQEMIHGNMALMFNIKNNVPVRLIQKSGPNGSFQYKGLYNVVNCKQEPDRTGYQVFKYEMHKLREQQNNNPPPNNCIKGRCLITDMSNGLEKYPVAVMNGLDSDKPEPFIYTTTTEIPASSNAGCDCCDDCSSTASCECRLNTEDRLGSLLGPKVIYECGFNCHCSTACKNRVTQNGMQYKLEVFKTGDGGWGVRSRSYISAGRYICEFAGTLLPAPQRRSNEDGATRFIIDATSRGNVARFVRSGEAPNALLQRVFSNGATIPRLVVVAAKSIPPLKEITLALDDSDHCSMFQKNI